MSFRHLKYIEFANLENTSQSCLKKSHLVLHKTFWKNVSETSCQTDFKTVV